MKCPQCQSENRDSLRFCAQCGTRMELPCPNCGAALPPDGRFCGNCGRALVTPPVIRQKDTQAVQGERKHVTVLFSDLSGYTALSEKLDPEEVREITTRIFGKVAEVVTEYEGFVEKYVGDAVLALFGIPKAHEDDPARAIRAARKIHEIVDAIGLQYEEKVGGRLAMHTGITTGLIVTGEVELEKGIHGVSGDTVNLASRLSGLGKAGEILVGETTQRLTKKAFSYEQLEPVSVKGKTQRIIPHRLTEENVERSHALSFQGISSPLVGRQVEFTAIRTCLNQLLEGQGGILSLIGEAGLGKSRLMAEIHRHFAKENLQWLEGRTLSYGQKMSYWPFKEILWHYAGIAEDEEELETWKKLEAKITSIFPSGADEVLPYIASLMTIEVKGDVGKNIKHLDGESMGRQIYLSSRRFFERLASTGPLVLVFEDLHWADESSVLLLEHLFPLINRVPLLLCGLSRPEADIPALRLRETAFKNYERRYTEIRLAPLSPTESTELMDNLLQIKNLPPGMRQTILQKAEGNPFFLEEIMRTLIDRRAVLPDQSGHWKITSKFETIAIPDTIQGVIMARIDRLDEELKQVLRTASVIGRAFLYRLLQAVAEEIRELDGRLGQLTAMELIREKQRFPELEYIFKHALVHESTYNSVLLKKRLELHARVASAIETLFCDRLEEFYAILAYHYAKAQRLEKAHEYLLKAGDQAGTIAADAEALSHYQQALETYARLYGDRWDLVQRASLERKMGEAFYRRGEHEKASEYLQRALGYLSQPLPETTWGVRLSILREIVVQVGHRLIPGWFVKLSQEPDIATEEEARIYEAQGLMHIVTNVEKSLLSCLRRLNFSERRGYRRGVVTGAAFVQGTAITLGLFKVAEYYGHMALAAAEGVGDRGAFGYACTATTLQEVVMGRLPSAIAYGRRAIEALRESGYWDPRVWGFAMVFTGWWAYGFSGNHAEALRTGRDLVRFGEDAGDLEARCFGLDVLGGTQYLTGQLDEAAYNSKKAIDLAESVPDHGTRIVAGSHLARCNLRRNNLGEALEVLRQTEGYLNEHHMRSYFVSTFLYNGWAEASLCAAEESTDTEREPRLKESKHRCNTALKSSKAHFRPLLPEAMRLKGTHEWLSKRPSVAEKWWAKSIDLADKMGMPYHSGLAHLEMGRRLGDRAHLERAGGLFSGIGAEWDLEQTRRVMEAFSPVVAQIGIER